MATIAPNTCHIVRTVRGAFCSGCSNMIVFLLSKQIALPEGTENCGVHGDAAADDFTAETQSSQRVRDGPWTSLSRESSRHPQHDFPKLFALFEPPMRLRTFLKRQHYVNHRLQQASPQKFQRRKQLGLTAHV